MEMNQARSHETKLLTLDQLFLPFLVRENPLYELKKEAMFRKVLAYDLVASNHFPYFYQFNYINKYFFPEATSERLMAVSRIVDIFFIMDDIYDTSAKNGTNLNLVQGLLDSVVQTIRTASASHDPSAVNLFIQDSFEDLLKIAMPTQVNRVRQTFCEYLMHGSLEMMKMWRSGVIPTYNKFCKMRDYDVALLCVIDLLEIANHNPIPDEIYSDEELVRYRLLATRHVGVLNDVLSYEKEVIRDQCPCNALWVYEQNEKKPFAESVSDVILELNELIRKMIDLKMELQRRRWPAGCDINKYLLGIEDLVAGHYYWCIHGTRYNSKQSPFEQLRTTESGIEDKSKGMLVSQVT